MSYFKIDNFSRQLQFLGQESNLPDYIKNTVFAPEILFPK